MSKRELTTERAKEIVAIMAGEAAPGAYRHPYPFAVTRDEILAMARAYVAGRAAPRGKP